MPKKVCLVTGVGPGTGIAIVKRFAGNYEVAMIARNAERLQEFKNELPSTHAYPCDVSDLDELESVFKQIENDLDAPHLVIHNAVRGLFGNFQDITPRQFESAYRVNATAFLRLAQLASTAMQKRGQGAIICTGNTAAFRGTPRYSGFAPSKAAQRILAESIARTLGPSGIHVSYVAIDAVISVPWSREAMKDKPDEFFAQPADIAEHIWSVAHQPKSAWTFESILRPFGEKW